MVNLKPTRLRYVHVFQPVVYTEGVSWREAEPANDDVKYGWVWLCGALKA